MQYFHLEPSAGDLQVDCLVLNLVDHLLDAGEISAAIDAAILDLDATNIGEFDSDPLFDFRAQRPIVTYLDGEIADYVQASIQLALITDVSGKSFLYLYGQEPDFHWPTVAEDILEIVERFGVRRIFTFGGMPAPVPHTRPADMLIRTTQRSDDVNVVHGYIEHYGVLSDLVEFKAGEKDIDVKSLRVRVPLYLARGDTPFYSGAHAAIAMMANLGGPVIPVGDLQQLEDEQNEALDAAMTEREGFGEVVAKLEEEYDHLPSEFGFVRSDEHNPVVPTSDEIGRAAEKFLELSSESPLDRAIGQKKKARGDLNRTDRNGDINSPFLGRDLRRGRHRHSRPDDSTETDTQSDESSQPES